MKKRLFLLFSLLFVEIITCLGASNVGVTGPAIWGIDISFFSEETINNTVSAIKNYYKYIYFPQYHELIVYILAGLSLVLFVVRRIEKGYGGFKRTFSFSYILLFVISLGVLGYFLVLNGDLWFCDFGEVGILMTIVNFFLFGFFLVNLVMGLIKMFRSLQDRTSYVSYGVFIKGYIFNFFGAIIISIFWGEDNLTLNMIILGVFALLSIIQLVQILISSLPSVKYSLLHLSMFIVGAGAVVVMLIEYLPMLIIALIITGVCSTAGGSSVGKFFSSSSSDEGSSEDYASDGYIEENVYTINDEHGYERTLTDEGFGTYKDDKGDYWESDGWNGVKRKE